MAITYPVQSGTFLPSRSAARQLVATAELGFITARYRVKPGQRERPAETVFMAPPDHPGGIFLPPYDARSFRDGNTYTIVREGGWPKDLELHAQEVGSGNNASLQPLNGSPLGAWALDGGMADRSGNSNTLTNARTCPDLYAPSRVPGKRGCVFNGCAPFSGYSGNLYGGFFNAANINNPFTIACWFACFGDLTGMNPAQNQLLFSTSGFGSLERVILGWNITASPPGKLFAYFGPTGQVGVSALNVPRDFGFLTVRQRPDGTTRLGVNKTFETVNIGPCVASFGMTIGQTQLGNGDQQAVGGILSDMIFWPEEKTDDFLLAQYAGSGGT